MKRIIFILTLLAVCFTGFGQFYQTNNTPYRFKYMIVRDHFGFANDTLTPPVNAQGYPHLAAIDTVVYYWSPATLAWQVLGSSSGGTSYTGGYGINIGGGVVRVDTVNIPTKSWVTGGFLEVGDTSTMLDNYTREQRFLDSINNLSTRLTGSYQQRLYFTGGLAKLNDSTVYALTDAALWNARKIQGYDVPAYVPIDGGILRFEAASNSWKFDTAGVGLTSESDPVWLAEKADYATIVMLNDYYTSSVVDDSLAAHWAAIEALQGSSGGSSTLTGLSDVTLASLANGDFLVYNSSTMEWNNIALDLMLRPEINDSLAAIRDAIDLKLNISDFDTTNNKDFTTQVTGKPPLIIGAQIIQDTLLELTYFGGTKDTLDLPAGSVGSGDYNLLVESLGATGEEIWRANNDTLYLRKIAPGFGVLFDTLATGEIQAVIDSSNADVQNWIALYGNDGNDGGGGLDSLEVVAYDSLAVSNFWINSTTNRMGYRLDSFYYHVAITDSVRYIQPEAPFEYDPDVELYVTEWETAASSTMDDPTKTAVNDFITGLKSASIYTKITEMWLFIGGTASTHAIGFKNAYDLTFFNSPTHSANGTDWNGTNQYANTGINAGSVLTFSSSHLSYYSRDDVNESKIDIGVDDASPVQKFHMRLRYGNNTSVYNTSNASQLTVAHSGGSGFFIGTRTSASLLHMIKNGTSLGNTTVTETEALPSLNVFIGALNNNGSAALFSTKQCAFASVGTGLTTAEAATFTTLVEALQDALSRGVMYVLLITPAFRRRNKVVKMSEHKQAA